MMLTVGHLQILGSCDNIAFQRPATDPHFCSLVSMSPQYIEGLRTQMMLNVVVLHISERFLSFGIGFKLACVSAYW